jgi:hypothetical protein
MSARDDSANDVTRGEILRAAAPGASQVEVGMEVASLDGQPIGKVKEVHPDEFLVDRPLARDLWVPFKFVLATEDYSPNFHGPVQSASVVLTVSGAHIDSQGWRQA